MATKVETSPANLAQALLVFQADPPELRKDKDGVHSKYVSLDAVIDAVRPRLNAVGVTFSQFPTHVDGAPALRTRLTFAPAEQAEEWIEETMLLLVTKTDPQSQGSAITYARRYSLLSMLGLTADEDDDGARASRNGGPVEGEMRRADAEQADRPISEAQRKVIFGKARGYDIDYALIPRIIRYATKGRLQNADAVETNGQLDYVLGQLLAFSKQPEAALAAIEKYELESGATAEQANSGEPELPPSDFSAATGGAPFAGSGGDEGDSIPFAPSVA